MIWYCASCRHVAKLATMDIFAGCGGLTCGLHKAGAAETKWSIEYEQPAAEAFKCATHTIQAVSSLACAVIPLCGQQQAPHSSWLYC